MELGDRLQRPVWDTERKYGKRETSPHFSLHINRDCLHATEGPAATSARPRSRQQSREIWRVTAQAAERAGVLDTSEARSVLTAKADEPRSVAHASR